ncbi:TolB family protein [Spirosoma soli]|uniref:TolB family protein n=2 Tax=Spirosoma soli TaxID=1770529 RepID=A0ABW5MFM7_9BACT
MIAAVTLGAWLPLSSVLGQIGTRFPAERKVVKDPVTGTMLTFLTSTPAGDTKIYQTHPQWTADGQWLVFRSNRVKGEALAVHEKDGTLIQVTEGGYTGMLNLAQKSMKLYLMRSTGGPPASQGAEGARQRSALQKQVVEVNLERLFADSKAGKLQPTTVYQRVCGTIPAEMEAGGDMALDAAEDRVYFRVGKTEAAKHLAADTKLADNFGPRNMGAGPAGLASMNVNTGEIKYVVSVPFQIGHVQANPFVTGEIIFCWETGGKSPQRTWTVLADGSGLRPLYPEADYEWVTHEAVISPDEVAIAIMGHRKINPAKDNNTLQASTSNKPADPQNPGQETDWGPSGTREKPTGLGIVNLRTREMLIAGQTPSGSGLWHVHGSADGRWAVGDDFARNIYLIDRHSHEMILLSAGHKTTAADHPHPTFSADGTRIEIQSAMLSADNRSMNICVIPVPADWLKRRYDGK